MRPFSPQFDSRPFSFSENSGPSHYFLAFATALLRTTDHAQILQSDVAFHGCHFREVQGLPMRLDEESRELQRIVEFPISVLMLPLADAWSWLDVFEGRVVGEREGHEAPAIEIHGGVAGPVTAVVAAGGTPAFALRVGKLPEHATPTAISLHPHADA